MHDDLCQATAAAKDGVGTLHCWRPPHNSSENHWDRDYGVYWWPTPLPVREPRKVSPFKPRLTPPPAMAAV